MIDIFGNELSKGGSIILPVSYRSLYLTSAVIEKLNEDEGKIYVRFLSTPKTKWIDLRKIQVIAYNPKPHTLDGTLGLCLDCVGSIIKAEQEILYKTIGSIKRGKVKSVENNLWVILETGERIRNVSIFANI